MKEYKDLSKEELLQLKIELENKYDDMVSLNLKLNMARGLPSAEQLDMEADFFNTLNRKSDVIGNKLEYGM